MYTNYPASEGDITSAEIYGDLRKNSTNRLNMDALGFDGYT